MSEKQQPAPPSPDPPFLETTPPPWAARGVAYLLILIFTTAVLTSIFVKVPESVSGNFVLVPVKGTDPIRASDTGFVAEVNVREGQQVKSGAPLFVIQSEAVGNRSADFQTSETGLKAAQEKMTSVQQKYASQRLAYQEELKKLQERITFLNRRIELKKEQLKLTTEIVAGYERLIQEGVASKVDYTNKKLEANAIALELEELSTDHAETESAIRRLQHDSSRMEAEFREATDAISETKAVSQIRMQALNKELQYSRSGNQLLVPAQCDGTVLRLRTKAIGAVVQEGEVMCELVCSGERLQAELNVPQLGLSRIRPGQGVKLLYDAFPYQRYGVRFGTVYWVSPAGVGETSEAVFPVRVDVQDESILVQGKPQPLLPGMRGKAHVVVEKRSLISYAFAPIRQVREMLKSPPSNQ